MRAFQVFSLTVSLAAVSLLLTGCGGRMVNKNFARELIIAAPGGVFDRNDVQVESVSQISGNTAVVETRLRAAFRLERTGAQWVIRDVRLGKSEWENMEDLETALRQVKISRTERELEKIAAAIQGFEERNSTLPQFKDYISLSDILYPTYLSPLIRIDPWGHPLTAQRLGPALVRLASPGPDGTFGTRDDINLTRKF